MSEYDPFKEFEQSEMFQADDLDLLSEIHKAALEEFKDDPEAQAALTKKYRQLQQDFLKVWKGRNIQ
jgi:uncharacterized protein with gpF-like domain